MRRSDIHNDKYTSVTGAAMSLMSNLGFERLIEVISEIIRKVNLIRLPPRPKAATGGNPLFQPP